MSGLTNALKKVIEEAELLENCYNGIYAQNEELRRKIKELEKKIFDSKFSPPLQSVVENPGFCLEWVKNDSKNI